MTALAAAQLGYRCHVFCPEAESPAKLVTPFATTARYDDDAALAAFAAAVDVVTFEFENVPAAAAELLAGAASRCGPARRFCASRRTGSRRRISCARSASPRRAIAAVRERGRSRRRRAPRSAAPAVLKTVRLGYDGKGQVMIGAGTDLAAAWRALGSRVWQSSRASSISPARSR